MTREEQKQFVEALTSALARKISALIENGDIPQNWDGIELRQYVADEVVWKGTLKGKRLREYRNAITISGKL